MQEVSTTIKVQIIINVRQIDDCGQIVRIKKNKRLIYNVSIYGNVSNKRSFAMFPFVSSSFYLFHKINLGQNKIFQVF